jgi:drug/metabolite transporter (DMT)-like permease
MSDVRHAQDPEVRRRLIDTAEGTHADAFTARDWAFLLAPGFIWGASFYFIAEGLRSFSPFLIAPMRIGFGFLALACFRGSRQPVERADLPRIALLGVFWMALPLTFFPLAEQRVSSSVAGMLNGAIPLFVAAVASILLRRMPGRAQLIGLAVGFAGIVLIGAPTLGEGSSSVVGVGLILLAVACYGIAINLAVPLQQRYGSLPVIWRAQATALVLTAPMGLVTIGDTHFLLGPFLAIAALGVLGTGVAYYLSASLGGRVGATRASITAFIIPAVAVGLGAVVLDEEVYPIAIVGCVVVLVGAWIAGRAERVAAPGDADR